MPNKIQLKPAHDALQQLIEQLHHHPAALKNLTPNVGNDSVATWIGRLQIAVRELENWCPDFKGEKTFGIDVDPQ